MKLPRKRKKDSLKRRKVVLNLFLLSILLIFLFLGYFIEQLSGNLHGIKKVTIAYPTPMVIVPSDVISPSPVLSVSPTPYPKYRLPILMYHYVEYVTDKRDTIRQKMDITPNVFEHEIKSLQNAGYTFHFLKEIPNIISGKTPYDPKMIFLTFDDGYEDFYTDAYPILKKYQIKSTEFIVYDFIGRYNYMKEDQIKDLVKDGLVEIASHTLDHTDLKGVSTESATLQIVDSRKKLSDRFKIPVTSFAYPYGAFSGYTVDLAKQAGYSLAVSVIPSVEQSQENLFYLSRVRPGVLGVGDVVKNLESYRK